MVEEGRILSENLEAEREIRNFLYLSCPGLDYKSTLTLEQAQKIKHTLCIRE